MLRVPLAAQESGAPSTTSSFTVFLRGTPIGAEQASVTGTANGWTIVTSGRLGPPLDVVIRKIDLRYSPDWKPLEATIDGSVRGQAQLVHTIVSGAVAASDITTGGQTTNKSDGIDPDALFLPNPSFGAFEAIAARLKTAAPGSTIPLYVLPQGTVTLRVGDSTSEQIQTAGRLIQTKRTHVTIATNVPQELDVVSDEANGRLLKISIPAQGLEVIRNDVASVAARQVTSARPNDEQVRIPANGFALAGTLSKPAAANGSPRPAVVLTGGSGPFDRDELAFGIPIFGQLADVVANAGFIVLRYDKRGVGQSGGRIESAALTDFADDLRAAVRFLAERKDVDAKRIAVAGYSEGGLIALLAAAKEKRIAAVALIETPGTSGAELVLAQQEHALNRSTISDAEKQTKINLQKQINDAIIAGKPETLPPDIRKQVDNREFQSLITTDPAKIVPEVHQPMLIVQGELDTQVAASNADKLAALARARRKTTAVDVVKVPGVNHLLVPAASGEPDEYASLTDRHVTPSVSDPLIDWLKKTLG